MNKNQRLVLIGVSVLVAIMIIFPPFQSMVVRGMHLGYSFILDPPGGYSSVNVPLLVVQIFGVIIIGGILFLVEKDGKIN